jgi:peptidyl-prolyl cis-trans isomerase A (cyclophilin A)
MSIFQFLEVKTCVGSFSIKLNIKQAPITCAYFIQLVSNRELADGKLFRILTDKNQKDEPRIKVIQLGSNKKLDELRSYIKHENTIISGLTHKKWCVSVARFKPGEVYKSFFICMRDEPSLDYTGNRHPDKQGFACFGEVVKGVKVVEKLYKMAGEREMLKPAISIESFDLVN